MRREGGPRLTRSQGHPSRRLAVLRRRRRERGERAREGERGERVVGWEQGLPNRGLTRYRSNRFGPVPVRYQNDPNSKFKFKKMKNSQKIPKNISRCDESNGVKFSQKLVYLV